METKERASSRQPGARSGIDRRTLIKRAAAAGAVAWTAPVIIGSLTSPAAAQTTGILGCTGMLFNGGNCNLDSQGTPCSFTLCPQTNDDALLAQCVDLTGDCQNGPFTISINAGCTGCTITDASSKTGDDCIEPTFGSGDKSVTWPVQASPGYAQHAINVLCV